MNTCGQISSPQIATAPEATSSTRRPVSRWQRLLASTRFVPVDLADTVFASLPNRPASPDAEVGPLPLPDRPKDSRLVSWRFL